MTAASASAYAGAAAHEEEVFGLPTHAQFKKHATFRTDIADFGVDIRQLHRLLAECGYGIAVGGMGLGDINILFNAEVKRNSALNFEGVLRLCRLIRPRLEKVHAEMFSTNEVDEDMLFEMGTVQYRSVVHSPSAAFNRHRAAAGGDTGDGSRVLASSSSWAWSRGSVVGTAEERDPRVTPSSRGTRGSPAPPAAAVAAAVAAAAIEAAGGPKGRGYNREYSRLRRGGGGGGGAASGDSSLSPEPRSAGTYAGLSAEEREREAERAERRAVDDERRANEGDVVGPHGPNFKGPHGPYGRGHGVSFRQGPDDFEGSRPGLDWRTAPLPGANPSRQQQQEQQQQGEGEGDGGGQGGHRSPPGRSPPRQRPASAGPNAATGGRAAGRLAIVTDTGGGGGGGGDVGGDGSGGGGGRVPAGLGTLMALRDPPVLLREHLPPPPCGLPAVAARIAGIQGLYRDGEMTRVALALRDLQRDWEAALEADSLAASIKKGAGSGSRSASRSASGPARSGSASGPGRSGSGAGGALAAAAAASAAADGSSPGEVPLEGRVWIALLHGCCLMLEGRHRTARKSLEAAQSLFDPHKLGMEHPYNYCIHLFFGLLAFYEQEYSEAIARFESARELAELVARTRLDLTARRNAAACLNNKGVCHSLLGNRAEAVGAFRAAHSMLKAAAGMPETPEYVVACRNLNKALKQAFALNTSRLRPTSAPPMYGTATAAASYGGGGGGAVVGATGVPKGEKLQVFLRSAITMRAPPPVTAAPEWCAKVTADDIVARKKAKELAMKAAARAAARSASPNGKPKKVTVPGPPPFDSMTGYPYASYGVANVKLGLKKKGLRRAAKKA